MGEAIYFDMADMGREHPDQVNKVRERMNRRVAELLFQRVFIGGVFCLCCLVAAGNLPCWARAKKADSSVASGSRRQARKLKPKKIKAILDAKRAELEDTQWEIDVAGGSQDESLVKDELLFKNGRFSSRFFLMKGFVPMNFSLSLQDDGGIVVESIQSDPEKGMVFWRGEFGDDPHLIRGMSSEVLPDKSTVDRFFNGRMKKIEQGEISDKP